MSDETKPCVIQVTKHHKESTSRNRPYYKIAVDGVMVEREFDRLTRVQQYCDAKHNGVKIVYMFNIHD